MKAFCRDCFETAEAAFARCPACGSPRVVAHAELDRLPPPTITGWSRISGRSRFSTEA